MSGRVARLGLYLTVALVLSYVESLIPFSPGIPGIKPGLPNLAVVLLLYGAQGDAAAGGVRDAALVNLLRIVLAGFLFGSLYSILYALAGAVCSLFVMCLFRRLPVFSIAGVSVLGGVAHNIGQFAAALFVTETVYLWYYLPFLIAAGTVAGMLVGVIAMAAAPHLQKAGGESV